MFVKQFQADNAFLNQHRRNAAADIKPVFFAVEAQIYNALAGFYGRNL